MFTFEQMLKIMPHAQFRMNSYYEGLTQAMEEYEINTPAREDMFLSALAWASGELSKLEEDGIGLPAEKRRYKGHGPFTIIDYAGATKHFRDEKGEDIDFVEHPGRLSWTDWVWRGACWMWVKEGCNALADLDDWDGIRAKLEIAEEAKGYLKTCREVRYQRRPEDEVPTDEHQGSPPRS